MGQVPVHDPVMINEGSTFYLFCTGFGIAVWSSKDLQNWKKEEPVFGRAPQWAVDTIPNFKGHIWAPDISFHNGQYYLYYSVSAFGKKHRPLVSLPTKPWILLHRISVGSIMAVSFNFIQVKHPGMRLIRTWWWTRKGSDTWYLALFGMV